MPRFVALPRASEKDGPEGAFFSVLLGISLLLFGHCFLPLPVLPSHPWAATRGSLLPAYGPLGGVRQVVGGFSYSQASASG
jgi:hypothetical protein